MHVIAIHSCALYGGIRVLLPVSVAGQYNSNGRLASRLLWRKREYWRVHVHTAEYRKQCRDSCSECCTVYKIAKARPPKGCLPFSLRFVTQIRFSIPLYITRECRFAIHFSAGNVIVAVYGALSLSSLVDLCAARFQTDSKLRSVCVPANRSEPLTRRLLSLCRPTSPTRSDGRSVEATVSRRLKVIVDRCPSNSSPASCD